MKIVFENNFLIKINLLNNIKKYLYLNSLDNLFLTNYLFFKDIIIKYYIFN